MMIEVEIDTTMGRFRISLLDEYYETDDEIKKEIRKIFSDDNFIIINRNK